MRINDMDTDIDIVNDDSEISTDNDEINKIIDNQNNSVSEENDKRSNKDSLKYLLKLFLGTRIILVILMILFEFLLSNGNLSTYKHVLELFDNEHYMNIAMNGYVHEYEYAFFPLTSILIRYLGKAGFLLLNQLCVLFSGYLLYLISDKILKKKDVYFASFLYFISPISVFTCMFYSEGIFIFLTILAFYLYKTKKSYLALGITLGLSVATRSLGSMLFFSIFIFMFIDFIKRKEKFKNILITYIPATIISCLYPIFLYFKTGNFLYFIDVQFIHWRRISTNIFTILFDVSKLLFSDPNPLLIFDYLLVFGLIFYIFFYIIKNRRNKDNYLLYLYMILSLISICSTIRDHNNALASFYRYIFGCFPLYFMIKKNYVSLFLMFFLTILITSIFLMGVHFY